MKIGELYQSIFWAWFIYSSMQEAEKTGHSFSPPESKDSNLAWIKQTYKVDVSCLEGMFVLLEIKGNYLKILQPSGEIGWLLAGDSYGIRTDCFKQVT